jgi:hypothetical protein
MGPLTFTWGMSPLCCLQVVDQDCMPEETDDGGAVVVCAGVVVPQVGLAIVVFKPPPTNPQPLKNPRFSGFKTTTDDSLTPWLSYHRPP